MSSRLNAALQLAVLSIIPAGLFAQGSLTPPGAPGATMKSLDEIYTAAVEAKNYAIAINATNTPGNATSIYVISEPGSYYLESAITDVDSKNGIEVTSPNVTIDLGGHLLTGSATSLIGVSAEGVSNVTVRNGAFTGWPDGAVKAGDKARIENLNVTSPSSFTVSVSRFSTVNGCRVTGGAVCISTSSDSIVTNNVTTGATGSGISVLSNTIVRGNVSENNDGSGISMSSGGGALIEGNTFAGNASGVNVCYGNVIRGNIFTDNTTAGVNVRCGANSVIENHFVGNAAGITLSQNNQEQVYKNTFHDNTANVTNTTGNYVAPLVSVSNATNPFSNLISP